MIRRISFFFDKPQRWSLVKWFEVWVWFILRWCYRFLWSIDVNFLSSIIALDWLVWCFTDNKESRSHWSTFVSDAISPVILHKPPRFNTDHLKSANPECHHPWSVDFKKWRFAVFSTDRSLFWFRLQPWIIPMVLVMIWFHQRWYQSCQSNCRIVIWNHWWSWHRNRISEGCFLCSCLRRLNRRVWKIFEWWLWRITDPTTIVSTRLRVCYRRLYFYLLLPNFVCYCPNLDDFCFQQWFFKKSISS